jgi:hypothetical protein
MIYEAKSPTDSVPSPGIFSTKAERREFEEKERRHAAVAKRVQSLSSSLEALEISFTTKSVSLSIHAFGTLRIKVIFVMHTPENESCILYPIADLRRLFL